MEDASEANKETENGEKMQAINEENIAKAAASALAAAAVKAKVNVFNDWLLRVHSLAFFFFFFFQT